MVDASGKLLTLETVGSSTDQPGKRRFREILEIKNKDHKVFTSFIEKDGKWVIFATVNFRRTK